MNKFITRILFYITKQVQNRKEKKREFYEGVHFVALSIERARLG